MTWNLNPGANGGDTDGVIATATSVAGRPGFTLVGTGGTVTGVVLHPSDAMVNVGVTGEPVAFSTTSKEIIVALLLDDGTT